MKGISNMPKNTSNQSGAVSLFVVIFSTLLITVATISFVKIMTGDQKQATDSDLSQSAYDSAMAGVEDGKRAILDYLASCSADPSLPSCLTLASSMSDTCNGTVSGLPGNAASGTDEVKLQTNTDDSDLNQAYTCVKINVNTPDYLGVLEKDAVKLIPLRGTGDFNKVKLDWFSIKDLSSGTVPDIPNFGAVSPLLAQGLNASVGDKKWNNRPSVMRTQLIQYSSASGFKLNDFDNNTSNKSNSATLFLYPSNIIPTLYALPYGDRRPQADYIKQVNCTADFTNGGYSCTATLELPDPIDGSVSDRVAYLNLSSLYSGANFRVTLYSGTVVVDFKQVQPEIDSTGRANDLFRRVKSRVEPIGAEFPYPVAAVDLAGVGLCKNFAVTNPDPSNSAAKTYLSIGCDSP